MKPIVAIVGRPNVGKSTLFNRLAGKRLAIVFEEPGTTRDRIVAPITWEERPLLLVDTGGLEFQTQGGLWEQVHHQTEVAIADAQVVILVTDASTGLHPTDQEAADLLRRTSKPVVLAANKAEGRGRELMASEFYQLGLGDPIPVSALHNNGIYDLMKRVLHLLPPREGEAEEEDSTPKLAIVGRPNVGKSSLLNAFVGEERALVHEKPGTTRDSLDTPCTYDGQPLLLIDTAGIRRRGRVEQGVEKYSVLRALLAIERCDVALLVLDATDPLAAQDMHIAGYVLETFKGLVVVVNKWDLAESVGVDEATALQSVRERLRWAPYVPIRFTSAVTGAGTREALEVALEVHRERGKQVEQQELNKLLLTLLGEHPPPFHGQQRLRLFGLVQSGAKPPSFAFSVNNRKLVHFSYQRFLENALRDAFGFKGNHLKLLFTSQRRGRG